MVYSVCILTVSDKATLGKREDQTGPLLKQLVVPLRGNVLQYQIVPDEKEKIKKALLLFCDQWNADLVLTTGGTGVSPRDVTPDATREIIDREIPGFGEVMRMSGFSKNPKVVISRAMAGVRGKTLIINFPGSVRAVQENFALLLPLLPHTLDKIRGDETDCVLV